MFTVEGHSPELEQEPTSHAQSPAPPPPDYGAGVFGLIAFLHDLKGCEQRLRALQEAEAKARKALTDLAAERASFDAKVREETEQLEKSRRETAERRLAVEAAKAAVDERQRYVSKREDFWRLIGEPEAVHRGFQAPELDAYQKASRAIGYPLGRYDPLLEAREAADDDVDSGFAMTPAADATITRSPPVRSAEARRSARRTAEA